MSRWWRAYDEALDDPKLQKMGLEMLGAWFNLMCLASKSGGKINIVDVPFALRVSKQKAGEIITRLATAGLLDLDGEDYRPHNWGGRQFLSDSNGNERVKRYRDKRVAAGLDRQWTPPKEIRKSVYARDGFRCVYCGGGADLTLDHRTPELRGGTHDVENLQTCCRVCNASKRDMTHDEFVTRNGGVTLLETELKHPHSRTEQNTEQNTEQKEAQQARDRSRTELDRIEATLRCAAGLENSPSPSLLNLAPILGLLDAGYSLEADIVPSIKAKKNGTKVRGWSYFVPAIRDARAQRVGAASVPAPKGKNDPAEVVKRQRNCARLWAVWTPEEREIKWHVSWNDFCGGPPGSSRCRIPNKILREFGLDGNQETAA